MASKPFHTCNPKSSRLSYRAGYSACAWDNLSAQHCVNTKLEDCFGDRDAFWDGWNDALDGLPCKDDDFGLNYHCRMMVSRLRNEQLPVGHSWFVPTESLIADHSAKIFAR